MDHDQYFDALAASFILRCEQGPHKLQAKLGNQGEAGTLPGGNTCPKGQLTPL